MKLIIDYLFWHYTEALKNILVIWRNYLIFFYHYFSISLLLSTLFHPWKRQYLAKTRPGFSLEEWATRITFNLFSKFIGALVRTATIFIWLLVECFVLILGALLLPIWILTPFLSFPVYWSGLEKNLQKTKRAAFEAFLSKRVLDQEDTAAVAAWFERVWEKGQKEACFWSLDNLLKTPGLGQDWAYGFTPNLDKYCQDLTLPRSYSHHLVGREKEIDQIEQILCRAAENNILLVGEAGVGKETIVLGFAKKVKEGRVFPPLKRKRVLKLDLTALLGEAQNEHEAADKLADLLKETALAGNIILVVFEFDKYTASGSGRADLTSSFLPYLSSSHLQVIGVTTPFSFQKFIFKNAQIIKLFETVEVDAPSKEGALVILEEILPKFEARVNVTVSYKALRRIIDNIDTLITHIPFPEKAIDLLDEMTIFAQRKKIKVVLPEHVDELLTQKTKVPVGEVTPQEKEKLTDLEKTLHQKVVDQEEAVSGVSQAMRRARLGVSQKNRPIGSFLFLGPTGVGKTQTAKALAWAWFGNEGRMIRIDFSEFQTQDGFARLMGDFKTGEPGILASKARENPFSVLLLDEIEKAHPKILNLFLQVLDEGYFTDAFGKKVPCQHLIIIGTSNAGAQFIRERVNRSVAGERLTNELINYVQKKHIFSPEFLNRFDGLVVFKPLTKASLEEIARFLLESLNTRLSKKKIGVKITPTLIKRVAEMGFHPALGARPMRRVIQDKIECQIAQMLLEEKIKKGEMVEIKI